MEPTTQTATVRRRRWPRRVAYVLLGLLALILLLVGGVLVYVNTSAGENFIREKAIEGANQAIQGKLAWEGLDIRGNKLVFHGLKLYDPEGKLVAEIDTVELELATRALVRKRFIVSKARVFRPRLYLVQDERGLNLTRAIASRNPKEKDPNEKQGEAFIKIDELLFEEGYVDLEAQQEERDLHVRIEDLKARGDLTYQTAGQKIEANLDLGGHTAFPVEGPLAARANVKLEAATGGGSVKVGLPGLELDAKADRQAADRMHLELKQLDLDPATAKAFLPSYPVKTKVALHGTAELDGKIAKFDLDGDAAGGRLHADGAVDTATRVSPGVTVTARSVNLADLVEDAPKTELSLDLKAKGGGKSLETLDAELTLDVPPSKVSGEPLGPVKVEARAKDGNFNVPVLTAVLPGVRLDAKARGTPEKIDARGTLEVSDLAKLGKTLGRIGKKEAPALSGNGRLEFTVFGPPKTPGITADGRFASLRLSSVAVRDLSLRAAVPDVTKPLDSDANLKVAYLKVGERVFRAVEATVQSAGQDFALELVTGGAMDLHLQAMGTRDQDSEGLALSALTLAYPEATWSLTHPGHLGFRDGELSADDLELAADQQKLALNGHKRGDRIDATVKLERFDLARLPKIAVDPALGLAGLIDADLTASGKLPRPTAEGSVRLQQGAFKQYKNLGLTLNGKYVGDRATGTLRAESDVADVGADFDVPVQGLLRRRKEPVKLVFNVDETDLATAIKALGRQEPATGKAAAQLVVSGDARDPVLALRLYGRDVRYSDYPPPSVQRADFDVRIESALEGKLGARVDLAALGMNGRIDVRTPFTLGQLIEKPPKKDALEQAAIELDLALNRVPLALLESAGLPNVAGVADVRAEARGTLKAPTVDAQVLLSNAALPNMVPVDGAITLVAGGEKVELGVEAHRGEQRLVELAGALAAPLERLMEPTALGDVPLKLHGVVHPLSLAELRPPPTDDDRQVREMSGLVLAKVDAEGTLNAPTLAVRSNMEELRFGDACIGRAAVAYDYRGGRSDLNVDLTSVGEGRLKLVGTAKLELGYAALKQGLKYETAPISAHLDAKNFELASFTGLIPKVRAIAGLLQADATVTGTVGKPSVRGDVEWKDGKLALEGYGDYREAHLLLHGTNEELNIPELKAKSGAGSFSLVANAKRQGSEFVLTGKADASRFPIVYDDQLMAIMTAKMTIAGNITSKMVDIRSLSIPSATVELPEVKRKDLQDLDRPNDIYFVRNGRPLKKRKQPAPSSAEATAPGTGGGDGAIPGAAPQEKRSFDETAVAADSSSLTYKINIVAPRDLWLKGTDVDQEVGLSEPFVVEYKDVSFVNGSIKFLHGRGINVLGRRFEVQKDSLVRFSGPPKRPILNLVATHRNEREQVTVKVTIKGEGKDVKLNVSSEPPLPETEIYTLLATGRRTLKRGSGASMNTGDAASIVGSLAASQLKKALSNKLPLDVFSIESTGEGLTGARVEMGKYLTDKFYIGYEQRLGGSDEGENTYGVRLEYQLSPNVSVEGQAGDQKKGADLIWSRDY